MIKKEILSQIIVMLLSLLWVNALLSGSIGNLPDRRNLSGHKKKKLTARIIWLNCQLFDYKPEKPFSFDPATIYNYNLLY